MLSSMPLKEMDGTLLTLTLLDQMQAHDIPAAQQAAVVSALHHAAHLHRTDLRRNRANLPATPYIEHPLRNTLRLLRLGITDPDILVATLLHDTVEDHAADIVTDYLHLPAPADPAHARHLALTYLAVVFGAEPARIVAAVSNPLPPAGDTRSKAQKRADYAAHVTDVITGDPAVFLVKFADFFDNAGSLHHTDGNTGRTAHLTAKYLPLVTVFETAATRTGLPDGTVARIVDQLTAVRTRLEAMQHPEGQA